MTVSGKREEPPQVSHTQMLDRLQRACTNSGIALVGKPRKEAEGHVLAVKPVRRVPEGMTVSELLLRAVREAQTGVAHDGPLGKEPTVLTAIPPKFKGAVAAVAFPHRH